MNDSCSRARRYRKIFLFFLRWYQGKTKFFLKKSLFLSTILVYKFVIEKYSQKIEFVKEKNDDIANYAHNDILAKICPIF